MDEMLKECASCIGITEDITIHGCTKAEHDAILQKFMEVTQKYGLAFNFKKMHVKAPAMKFFGCLYDKNGIHPNPQKVDAVYSLPTQTNNTYEAIIGVSFSYCWLNLEE